MCVGGGGGGFRSDIRIEKCVGGGGDTFEHNRKYLHVPTYVLPRYNERKIHAGKGYNLFVIHMFGGVHPPRPPPPKSATVITPPSLLHHPSITHVPLLIVCSSYSASRATQTCENDHPLLTSEIPQEER